MCLAKCCTLKNIICTYTDSVLASPARERSGIKTGVVNVWEGACSTYGQGLSAGHV